MVYTDEPQGKTSTTSAFNTDHITMQQTGKLYLIPVLHGRNGPPYHSSICKGVPLAIGLFYCGARQNGPAFHQGRSTSTPTAGIGNGRTQRTHQSEAEYRSFSTSPQWPEYWLDVGSCWEKKKKKKKKKTQVADPGAVVVDLAHRQGIQVLPLVGPSSILLALMGSGMNGQKFCFQGYLSAKKQDLGQQLKHLEQLAERDQCTQIFIEAPYRNQQIVAAVLQHLAPQTRLCIAVDLTLPSEYIVTRKVEEWKESSSGFAQTARDLFIGLST